MICIVFISCPFFRDNFTFPKCYPLVNVVSPWYIRTELAEQVLSKPEYLKTVLDRTPMKRVGSVDEVSSIVAFLCMDCASFITGQNIAVDGAFIRNGFY
jgi:Tropinone reductase 1